MTVYPNSDELNDLTSWDTHRLVNMIKSSSEAYYNTDRLLVSDSLFDRMVDELRSREPNHPILSTPGWGGGLGDHLEKFKHDFFVGGLNKVKSSSLAELDLEPGTVVMNKLDGISAVAYYENGALTRILTRGDGVFGLDISKSLYHLIGDSIPCEIDSIAGRKSFWVRGEVLVPVADVEGSGYKNARNMAAGLCNQSERGEFHNLLKFVAYSTADTGSIKSDQLEWLGKSGFEVVDWSTDQSEFDTRFNYTASRVNSPYLLDGAVVDSYHETPYAVKFDNVTQTAKVVKVHYEVSGRGRVNPVIEIEPLEIDGTTVTYCSGFNCWAIKEDQIGEGAEIQITKANEVIPHWVSTDKPGKVDIPESIDGRDTYWDGAYLRVRNTTQDYLNNTRDNLLGWYCPHGFGWAKVSDMIEYCPLPDLKSLRSLLDLGEEELRETLSKALSATYIDRGIELISSLRNGVKLSWLLQAPMLTGLGEVSSEIIARYYQGNLIGFQADLNDGIFPDDLFQQLPTYVPRDVILNNPDIFMAIFNLDWKIIPEDEEEEPASEDLIKITLTGTLSKSRSQILDDWKSVVVESHINSAEYLVTNDVNSNSSKAKKARSRGIEILTEEEFVARFIK